MAIPEWRVLDLFHMPRRGALTGFYWILLVKLKQPLWMLIPVILLPGFGEVSWEFIIQMSIFIGKKKKKKTIVTNGIVCEEINR